MTVIAPAHRYWSLAFGVVYLAGAVGAGFNLDLFWELFAPDGVRGQTHHMVSVLTSVFPHIIAVAGFVLLIAGQRISRRVFVLIAAVPVAYFLLCVYLRTIY